MDRDKSVSDSNSASRAEPASDAFTARHKSVFAFDEVKLSVQSNDNSSERRRSRDDDRDVSDRRDGSNQHAQDFKGRESIFRVTREEWTDPRRDGRDGFRHPRNSSWTPSARRRDEGRRAGAGGRDRVPDFKRNPQKYTKYSLDDAAPVSHESNRQAAFDFLNELRKRKADGKTDEEEESSPGVQQKIAFKKPISKKTKPSEEEDKPSSSSSAAGCRGFVLPECVVGERKEKKKPESSFVKKVAGSGDVAQKSMTLSHLMEEEEESD